MSDPIDFRAAVRSAMERRGLNPKRLADEAGVDTAQVYRYLSGERGVSDDTLGKLLAALGITLKLPRAKTPA